MSAQVRYLPEEFQVKFYLRDLRIRVPAPTKARLRVQRYSRHAKGGNYEAIIEAAGSIQELAELVNWARYPMEIYNPAGTLVWWGYLREIDATFGNVHIKVNINRMANRVAVAYTLTANGSASVGERRTTPWVQHNMSIAEFGRRELLVGEGGISEVAALAKRNNTLNDQKYPQGHPEVTPLSTKKNASKVMTITCEGWWHTLDWLYATVPTQLVASFGTIGLLEQSVGRDYVDDANNVVRLAQTIITGPTAWNVLQVGIYLKRVGLPLQNLTVALCDLDANGRPSTVLASGTITPSSVSTDYAWLICTLSSSILLAARTRYAIQVSYSGSTNDSNYYVFALDERAGYAGGIFQQYVSEWTVVSADMPFRLRTNTLVASDAQIHSLVSGFGQFFQQVFVQEATGVELESYRPGDTNAKTEVEALMEIGTASGARLLADVDAERKVRIFPMPGEDTAVMYLREDGQFYHRNVSPIDSSTCPVGFWALPAEILPSSVDTSRISGLGAFFVEEAEYDVARGVLYHRPLGADKLFRTRPEVG